MAVDHRYRLPFLPASFATLRVLDVGSFDGFYAVVAEARGRSGWWLPGDRRANRLARGVPPPRSVQPTFSLSEPVAILTSLVPDKLTQPLLGSRSGSEQAPWTVSEIPARSDKNG
jgi:hypothetical protein